MFGGVLHSNRSQDGAGSVLCMQHSNALVLSESLTAHSAVWRRLP